MHFHASWGCEGGLGASLNVVLESSKSLQLPYLQEKRGETSCLFIFYLDQISRAFPLIFDMDSKPDIDDLIILEIICESSDSFSHLFAKLSGPGGREPKPGFVLGLSPYYPFAKCLGNETSSVFMPAGRINSGSIGDDEQHFRKCYS